MTGAWQLLADRLVSATTPAGLVELAEPAVAARCPGAVILLRARLAPADDPWWDHTAAVVRDFFGGRGRIPSMMIFESHPGPLPPTESCLPLVTGDEFHGFLGLPSLEGHPPELLGELEAMAALLAMRLDHLRLAARGDELMPFLLASQQKAVMGELLRQRNEELEDAYQEVMRNKQQLVQAEKLTSLGRFTAGIAHELNTPLGAILNSTGVLQELVTEYRASIGDPEVTADDHRAIADELGQALDVVRQAAEKGARLVRTLKHGTRDTGEMRDFAARPELEGALLLLEAQVRKSSCQLIVELGPPEVVLHGDATRLGQVVTNLVLNALDACEARPGTVRLEALVQGQELLLRVSDTGCGIPPEHLDRLFEPMFTTKDVGKGTGLGLYIVEGIVRGHFGGRIEVSSVLGAGSTFSVYLPRR